MTRRAIRPYGDPVLRTACDPIPRVSAGVRQLVQDLLDTVDSPDRAGVAANQIGVGLRAFAWNLEGEVGYVLNPRLVEQSPELVSDAEGCLSVPSLWYPTARAVFARVEGHDLEGEPVIMEGEALVARCLLHEYDHLEGLLYLDRLDEQTKKEARRRIRAGLPEPRL